MAAADQPDRVALVAHQYTNQLHPPALCQQGYEGSSGLGSAWGQCRHKTQLTRGMQTLMSATTDVQVPQDMTQ